METGRQTGLVYFHSLCLKIVPTALGFQSTAGFACEHAVFLCAAYIN